MNAIRRVLRVKLLLILFLGIITNLAYSDNQLNEDLQYKEALTYFEKQEFEKAVGLLTELIDKNPDKGLYHTLIGHTYQRIGKKDEARDHFDKAIKSNVNDGWAYVGRAMVSTDFTEEKFWLNQALEKFPFHAAPYTLLVSGYMFQAIEKENSGDITNALKFLEEAKKIHEDFDAVLEGAPDRVIEENNKMSTSPVFSDKMVEELKRDSKQWVEDTHKLEKEWKQRHGIIEPSTP